MKTDPGTSYPHKGILFATLLVASFLIMFFLAPIVHVIDACTNAYESPGYYLFKVGFRVYFGPGGCI